MLMEKPLSTIRPNACEDFDIDPAAGVVAQVCPLVPIMPDNFLFVREMWSFWATETVWNGEALFSKVEQRPSFFGEGWTIEV